MKNILFISLGIVLVLLYSCSKEKIVPPVGEIVNLTVNAIAPNDTLELLKDGKVIFQTKIPGLEKTKITVNESGAEIQIRKKGEKEILATRTILPNAFNQTIDIIFEDGKIYEKFVNLKISGYKESGILEVYIDGRLLPAEETDENGDPVIPSSANVPVEAGKNRHVEVRKRGEMTAIASQEILSDQDEQEFKFYFDGQNNITSIDVDPLKDQQNMLAVFKFKSRLDIYNGPADIVIFKDRLGVQTATDLRTAVPEDGSFSKAIELPSLTSAPRFTVYIAKLVKRGTLDEIPYHTANEVLPITSYGFQLNFVPGTTAIISSKDDKQIGIGTTFMIFGTDVTACIKTINFK